MAAARASFFLLTIIYLGFVSLGLPDGTLGVAWPAMYRELGLPIGFAGTIIIIGTVLSAVAALTSGKTIARFSTGPVVLVSCLLTGSGMMTIAHTHGVGGLILAAVFLGLGAGAVDAALNGYVAKHYTGRHMNWLHACWGIGATCGPLVLAQVLRSETGWRSGYFGIAVAQLSLAVVFLLTLGLWKKVHERPIAVAAGAGSGRQPVAQANSPAGWLSLLIFGIYVGVETTAGLWAGSILVVSRGIAADKAAICVAFYYGAITGGRILVGVVVERWGNRRVIFLGTCVALVGAALFVFAPTVPLAALALTLVGLGFAPVYPGLMHEVPRRFAPAAVQSVIGRQSGAAALGYATLPPAAGWLAERSLEGIAWGLIAGILALMAVIRRLNRIT
ncbi:MAG: MFS transporter [Opitutaceae bacterium]